MKEVFTRTAENISRYKNGNLYLSVKIDGKRLRYSLETNDLRIANQTGRGALPAPSGGRGE